MLSQYLSVPYSKDPVGKNVDIFNLLCYEKNPIIIAHIFAFW